MLRIGHYKGLVSVFLAIAAVVLTATETGADMVIVWGDQEPPDCALANLFKIAAGGEHSLALKRGPCPYDIAGDLDDNCKVDFLDFVIMAGNWLVDCFVEPMHPGCVKK